MSYSIKIVLLNGEPVHFHDVERHGINQKNRMVEIHRVSKVTVDDGIFIEMKEVPSRIFLCLDAISYMEVEEHAEKKED